MALLNNAPLGEPMAEEDGRASRAWSSWFGQVFRGSAFLGAGATADRPALKDLRPGTYYFDTSLGANGKPIFVRKDGAGWILADGSAA